MWSESRGTEGEILKKKLHMYNVYGKEARQKKILSWSCVSNLWYGMVPDHTILAPELRIVMQVQRLCHAYVNSSQFIAFSTM